MLRTHLFGQINDWLIEHWHNNWQMAQRRVNARDAFSCFGYPCCTWLAIKVIVAIARTIKQKTTLLLVFIFFSVSGFFWLQFHLAICSQDTHTHRRTTFCRGLINELNILCQAELGYKICCQILQLLLLGGFCFLGSGLLLLVVLHEPSTVHPSHIAHTPCGSCNTLLSFESIPGPPLDSHLSGRTSFVASPWTLLPLFHYFFRHQFHFLKEHCLYYL